MEEIKGSATFRLFSYGAFFFFGVHVFIQWAITKLIGPFGKKSTEDDDQDNKSNESLDDKKSEVEREKMDAGFKDVDLTRS